MVRNCPRCELRFVTEGELREHLAVDHGAPATVLDPYRYPTGTRAEQPLYRDLREEPADRPRRYLVVANQSIGGETLTRRVTELLAERPCSFHVVVPATGSDRAQAAWRLRRALALLDGLGVKARGEVGPPGPLEAVEGVLAREQVDEVIVSTLPASLSRWLAADVPGLVARRFGLPVTTVVAERAPAAGT